MAPTTLAKRAVQNGDFLGPLSLAFTVIGTFICICVIANAVVCVTRRRKSKHPKTSHLSAKISPRHRKWWLQKVGKKYPTDPETGLELQQIPSSTASTKVASTKESRRPGPKPATVEDASPTFSEVFGRGSFIGRGNSFLYIGKEVATPQPKSPKNLMSATRPQLDGLQNIERASSSLSGPTLVHTKSTRSNASSAPKNSPPLSTATPASIETVPVTSTEQSQPEFLPPVPPMPVVTNNKPRQFIPTAPAREQRRSFDTGTRSITITASASGSSSTRKFKRPPTAKKAILTGGNGSYSKFLEDLTERGTPSGSARIRVRKLGLDNDHEQFQVVSLDEAKEKMGRDFV